MSSLCPTHTVGCASCLQHSRDEGVCCGQNIHKVALLARGAWSQRDAFQSLVGHRRTVIAARCNPRMFLTAAGGSAADCVVALGDMAGTVRCLLMRPRACLAAACSLRCDGRPGCTETAAQHFA